VTRRPITKDLVARHGLTDEAYKRIVEILRREPNLSELGRASAMWSEHCSYRSSYVHLKRLPFCKGSHLFGKCGDPTLRVIHDARLSCIAVLGTITGNP